MLQLYCMGTAEDKCFTDNACKLSKLRLGSRASGFQRFLLQGTMELRHTL